MAELVIDPQQVTNCSIQYILEEAIPAIGSSARRICRLQEALQGRRAQSHAEFVNLGSGVVCRQDGCARRSDLYPPK